MSRQFLDDLAVLRRRPTIRKLESLLSRASARDNSETSKMFPGRHLPADLIESILPYCFDIEHPEIHRNPKGDICFTVDGVTAAFGRDRMKITRCDGHPFGERNTLAISGTKAVAYVGNSIYALFCQNEGYFRSIYVVYFIQIERNYFSIEPAPDDFATWCYVRRHPCGTVQFHNYDHTIATFWDPYTVVPTMLTRECENTDGYGIGEHAWDKMHPDMYPINQTTL